MSNPPTLQAWARRWLDHKVCNAWPVRCESTTAHWPVPNYTAWWQGHDGVNNLPKLVTQPRSEFCKSTNNWQSESNPRPLDRKSDAQPTVPVQACVCDVGVLWLDAQVNRLGFWSNDYHTIASYFLLHGAQIYSWKGRPSPRAGCWKFSALATRRSAIRALAELAINVAVRINSGRELLTDLQMFDGDDNRRIERVWNGKDAERHDRRVDETDVTARAVAIVTRQTVNHSVNHSTY